MYDLGGNITSKKEYAYKDTEGPLGSSTKTYTYEYGDANWKDKLTKITIDGQAYSIQSDSIGNLTSDGVYTYSWQQGRQLKSINGNGKSLNFKYNDKGIRTEKTVNGVTTKYHLVGTQVTYEDNGTDKIYYTYDGNSRLISFNYKGKEYYYIRNTQGDIIGLYDSTGTKVVTYTYDSWGKHISIVDNTQDKVGEKNPYRYRGYRYDSETGLYYLNSRYYNPDWGRFINADGIVGQTGELLGHNLFAYCKNNVVNMSDDSGYRPVYSLNGEETDEMRNASYAVMNKRTKNISQSKVPNDSKKMSDTTQNFIINTATSIGNEITSSIKRLNPYKFKTLQSVNKYMFSKTPAMEFMKKVGIKAGYAGVAYGLYDAGEDFIQGKLMGALIDFASCGISAAAGYGIGVLGTGFITTMGLTTLPAAIVTGGAIVGGIVIGLGVSYVAELGKSWWYRRENQ
ncbi:RHS repeat-associated core domain-containing protein [Haloimpatiens sp. FM7330]|uniref:RHS repeat-associated core domain-containing protein n=1 Tax=Haloimpatiens sp. FM7330 TaxID=3298610 RepID=UPI003639845C